VRYGDRTIARTPPLGLDVDGLLRADALPAVTDSARRYVDTTIRPPVPEKRAVIADRYNELRLSMGPSLAVTFRAYDDGVAYRFEAAFPGTVTVLFESAGLNLADTDFVRIALTDCGIEADCFHSSFEQTYARFPVCDVPSGHLAFLPVLVETQGVHLVFTESDLWDYPGLWLRGIQVNRRSPPTLPDIRWRRGSSAWNSRSSWSQSARISSPGRKEPGPFHGAR